MYIELTSSTWLTRGNSLLAMSVLEAQNKASQHQRCVHMCLLEVLFLDVVVVVVVVFVFVVVVVVVVVVNRYCW